MMLTYGRRGRVDQQLTAHLSQIQPQVMEAMIWLESKYQHWSSSLFKYILKLYIQCQQYNKSPGLTLFVAVLDQIFALISEILDNIGRSLSAPGGV